MQVMFIGLLFSITIGNVLYAMEDKEKNEESNELGILSASIQSDVKIVKNLLDMKKLAQQLVPQIQLKKERGVNGLSELEELEIPPHITICPEVFDDFMTEEGLKIGKNPGCFRKFVCGRSSSNQFKNVQDNVKKKWEDKLLIAIYESEDDDSDTNKYFLSCDEDSISGSVVNHIVWQYTGLQINKPSDDVVNRLALPAVTINTTDNKNQVALVGEAKQTAEKSRELQKAKLECIIQRAKGELSNGLCKYIIEQQIKEAYCDKWKERGVGLFLAVVAATLGTYFGINGYC